MFELNKTKIVATVGPSTNDKETLHKLIKTGVSVFRINFSHAEYDLVSDKIQKIRSLNKEYGFTTSILADLQGPKLRIGEIEPNVTLKKGETFTFISGSTPFVGNSKSAYMHYKNFANDVKPGEQILVDDGKLIFVVKSTNNKDTVVTEIIQGKKLGSKKGVNLPNTDVSLPALTEKDIADAIFAIKQEVDWIALSFVRHAQDILDLKKIISEHSAYHIPIISKIEKPEALKNIDEIVKHTDGLMVARGDLGVEIPSQEVPLVQKELVYKAKLARKPIIIATHMLESMIHNLTPTRAEVNDVANSVMDGTDAVMLSGETSIGDYPVEVVKKMASIITSVEHSELISVPYKASNKKNKRFITRYICYNAAKIAEKIDAKAIITLTNSGYTAFQISAVRPRAHILVFTENKRILTRLNLLWGVKAFHYDKETDTDTTVEEVNKIALKKGFVKQDELLINLVAMPIKEKGMVNTLRISKA